MGRRAAHVLLLVALVTGAAIAFPQPAAAHVAPRVTGDDGVDLLRCVERIAVPQIDQAIDARWAPDSTHIAVTRIARRSSAYATTGYEEDPYLVVVDVRRGAVVADLGPGEDPQWSASGAYLSMWRHGQLEVVRDGAIVATVDASMPGVRWVGDQLVYWSGEEIRGWTEAEDVAISTVSPQYVPAYPSDWTELSADGRLFTLTRYRMDGSAERYVGETRTGQLAPLATEGTTYTEWSPTGETLLVRSNDAVELRGSGGWDALAPLASFPGPVHGWTADGKELLMGAVSPALPVGPVFDRFEVWNGIGPTGTAMLPNLVGARGFSPDGRSFAGIARTGLAASALEVYRCGTRPAALPSRADPLSRVRQQAVDTDGQRFVRPVSGFISQFRQGAHTGVDVAAPLGSLITASEQGEVTFVGWEAFGGRGVCVRHAGGLESCYYHTSLALVRVGQHVERGQPIAAVGMTGLTTGPHVHWEVKLDGAVVDPLGR